MRRPTVDICRREDFVIDRYELWYPRHSDPFLKLIADEINAVSPETEVVPILQNHRDLWNLEEVYAGLYDFANHTCLTPLTWNGTPNWQIVFVLSTVRLSGRSNREGRVEVTKPHLILGRNRRWQDTDGAPYL